MKWKIVKQVHGAAERERQIRDGLREAIQEQRRREI